MKRYQFWLLGMVLPVALGCGVCLCLEAFGIQPSFFNSSLIGSGGLISIIVILLIHKRWG